MPDNFANPPDAGHPDRFVAVRVVTKAADAAAIQHDLVIRGSHGLLTGPGGAREFDTTKTWPIVRGLLPGLDVLRAAPRPTRIATPLTAEAAQVLPEQTRAYVGIVVAAGSKVEVRNWLATESALYACPVDAGPPTQMSAGALAEQLIWDLTGAFEHLVAGGTEEVAS